MNTLTITELAERLQVERTTVYRWVRAGHFPGAHRAGPGKTSPVRIPIEDVEAFEAKILAKISQPTKKQEQ